MVSHRAVCTPRALSPPFAAHAPAPFSAPYPLFRPAGKGLVQSIQKLTDGSAVVLTVAKYRTPRGNDINGKGVTPNLSVTCETGADAVSCLDAALTKG